jgi:Lar family restriction alleviation protein
MSPTDAEIELLPCPFCGGDAIARTRLSGISGPTELVGCIKCGADTKAFKTESEAITAWNTRASPTRKQSAESSVPGHDAKPVDDTLIWKVCPYLRGLKDCDHCPSMEITPHGPATRGCHALAAEAIRVAQTGSAFGRAPAEGHDAEGVEAVDIDAEDRRAMISAAPKPGDASEQG